ncbi:MAG: chorismate-binding protein [Tannerellaceae bacterium]|jgi:isochorismate synthase|nr:chorismate-binding protein [Tannerellaceae bacterium]
MGDIERFLAIDVAIRDNHSLAVCRIPGEGKLHLTVADYNATFTCCDASELNGKEGFVIAPFFTSEEYPIVCIQAEEYELPIPEDTFPSPDGDYPFARITTSYPKRFRRFAAPLREGVMNSLMLSRCVKTDRPNDFSPALTFLRACCRNPHTYVYLVHSPYSGTWIGFSPVPFLSGETTDWQVSALGGIQPLINGLAPLAWTEKNCNEQQMMADCIQAQLELAGLEWSAVGPYAILSEDVAHLKKDFHFKFSDNKYIGDLLKLLYPTPSVCGIPCKEAYQFIINREGYDRRYYSGFVGRISPDGWNELFLNLQCMEVFPDILNMYVGSNLVEDTTAAEEWRITEAKLRTLRTLLD